MESSAASFSDIPAYVLSRLNLTAEKSSSNGSETESSQSSQFGMMYERSTENRGEEKSMSSAAASLAKTSALQGKKQELTESTVVSGEKCREWLARYDRNTSSWKTRQLLLFEDSDESWEIWPRWGMMQDGECFPAERSAVCICENASSFSLPTPVSSEATSGRIFTPNIRAKSFRTKTGSWRKRWLNGESSNLGLTRTLRLSLPTIGYNEYKGSGSKRFLGSKDFRGAKMSEGLRTCKTDPIYLNPLFAELVMMWPTEWTDLRPLATDRFREWLNSHGNVCPRSELAPTTPLFHKEF